jgi:hypothetical protein
MGVWDWIREFRLEAKACGDEERLRLLQLYDAAGEARKVDPKNALELLRQARAVAERLGERWWVLHTDHWRLQYLLNDLLAMNEALDVAAPATLEARKPEYALLPQRVCLHEDLVSAYVGIDPAGHADAIRQALEFMRGEVSDEVECRYCVTQCEGEFTLACGRLDESEACARRTLAMADADRERHTGEFHAAYAYCDLCEIAWRRGDWEALRGYAAAGEDLARRCDIPRKVCEFLVWHALLARRDGDEGLASRLGRQAIARMARIRALPSPAYYHALAAFHEQGGELEAALRVRAHELQGIAGKGRLFQECRARVERCRLLTRIGLPPGDELAAAREAAGRLRDPAGPLADLDRITTGE